MNQRLLGITLTCLALTVLPAVGHTQEWPTGPIKIVVPFPAGGATDYHARLYGDKLGKALGQPVIVENRPGAGGVVGSAYVASSKPDGYTLLHTFVSHAINPSIYEKLPYNTEKDFIAIAKVTSSANVIVVSPTLPVNSLRELIDYVKANPGKVNYASSGPGSNSHLASEMLNKQAGLDMVHVPYKGAPAANQDVIAGVVQVHIPSIPIAMPLIAAGRLKPIAVTSASRLAVLPAIPTVAETLPGYEAMAWDGVTAPAGTPPAVVARLSSELGKIMKSPDVVKSLTTLGADPDYRGPDEFDAFIRSETARWSKAAQEANVKPGKL